MRTETTQSSQARLWAGVVSSHAPTSWGWGSIFAIFTSWASTTSRYLFLMRDAPFFDHQPVFLEVLEGISL